MRDIHLEERPVSFKQVVGQKEACQQLMTMAKAEEGIPHCILFTGPSGCGKTTLARIVRNKLKCDDNDFCEVNAAESRGIDMVRTIQSRIGFAPMGGGESRVWLIDEAQALTADAQSAFLKILEEPPPHVYFMLATTDPQKLKKAIRTRCTEIKVRELTEGETIGLVNRIAGERHGEPLEDAVSTKLAEVAEGSARKALVLLQQVIGIEKEEDQINALQKSDTKQAAIEIARALMSGKTWKTLAPIIKGCSDDPEGIRRLILAYFTSVALGGRGDGKAIDIMEEFEEPYFNTGKAGLVMSCYRATNR